VPGEIVSVSNCSYISKAILCPKITMLTISVKMFLTILTVEVKPCPSAGSGDLENEEEQ
jgi:hypothetical protein